jgi:hypothetical protein
MADPLRISLTSTSGGEIDPADPHKARLVCGEFGQVRVRVENRGAVAVSLLVRVQAYQVPVRTCARARVRCVACVRVVCS